MAIQIGQIEPGCNDPVGLMTACHRRIERFLKTLQHAAQHLAGRKLSPEEEEALSRALRYFREAAPKHTADEEDDLFPALIRHQPATAEAVHALEQDHLRAARLHAVVDQIAEQWIRDGVLGEGAVKELKQALDDLALLYGEHIRTEETELFPRASQVLQAEELDAIGRRMAERRGVPFVPKAGTNAISF